jgi:MFS transporter, DHA1 family, tetracycline resistance protein
MKIKTILKKNLENPLLPIWTSIFLEVIGFQIIFPYLPRFFLDLGASIPMIGFYLSVNAFIGFFSGIVWGRLSDRYGRRPILIICRIGAMAGYIFLAFSTNLNMLLFSRIIDGIFSRSIPVTFTVLGDMVHAEKRSKEMSKIGIAWIVGGLIGPGLGALLSVNGLVLIGIFCAVTSLAALIISVLTLKESKPYYSDSFAADKLMTQTKKPLFSLDLLRQHNPRLLLSQNLFAMMAHFIFTTTMTLYISKQLGLSIAQIGGVLTIIGVINLLVRLTIFPCVLHKVGDKKTFTLGLFVFLAAFTWLVVSKQLWEFIAITVLISFATNCSMDVMIGILSKVVRKQEMGEIMGLNSAAESISLILGPLIGSYLLALPSIAFYGMSSIVCIVLALVIGLIRLRQVEEVNT